MRVSGLVYIVRTCLLNISVMSSNSPTGLNRKVRGSALNPGLVFLFVRKIR